MPADNSSERQFRIEVFGATDVGRSREHNEDAFVVFGSGAGILTWFEEPAVLQAPDRRLVLMVADGMGGAAAGEVASALALDSVVTTFQNAAGLPAWTLAEAQALLLSATLAANIRVHEAATSDPSLRGMGTTATIAALQNDILLLSQIGDSRAYLNRAGVTTQLTRDQSLIQRLVDTGDLTAEEAERNERRNIILQALGPEPTISADISVQQLRDGDLLLLCSDGLSGQITAEDMSAVIGSTTILSQVARSMIDVANERGGPDNITVLLARFTGGDLLPPSSDDRAGYLAADRTLDPLSESTASESALDRIAQTRGESIRQILTDARAARRQPVEAGAQPIQTHHQELSTPIVVAIVTAAALGVATIIYRQFLMG